LELNIDGRLKTWAVKWYASMFINDGYALHPNISYVNNIGHDSTGENCGASSVFNWDKLSEVGTCKMIPVEENPEAREMMIKFYYDRRNPPTNFRSVVAKILPPTIKNALKRIGFR
jgi:hypothetical protein